MYANVKLVGCTGRQLVFLLILALQKQKRDSPFAARLEVCPQWQESGSGSDHHMRHILSGSISADSRGVVFYY